MKHNRSQGRDNSQDRHQQATRHQGSAGNGPRSGGQGVPTDRKNLTKRGSDQIFERGTKVNRSNFIDAPVMRGGIRL